LLKLPSLLRKPAPPVPRDRFRPAVDHSPLGVAFVDRDGAWLYVNDRFAEIAGYTQEQLRRVRFNDITHADDAKREATFLRRLRNGDIRRYRIEKRIVDRRGYARNVVVAASLAGDFFVFVMDDTPEEPRRPAVPAHERAFTEQVTTELRRTIDDLRLQLAQREAELARRDNALEEKTNELRIMANALRTEIARRKVAEGKLVEERLPAPQTAKWMPLDVTPAELLVAHGNAEQTGTLVIASGRREVEIFFEKGRVFSVSSSDPSRFLTVRLIERGIISEEQRQRALEIQRATHLALGRILTMLGAVSEEQLVEVLQEKAEEEIGQVLSWRNAKYAFVAGEIPSLQLVPMRIDVGALLLAHVADELEDEIEIPPPPPPRPPATELLLASAVARKFHRMSCGAARRLDEETRIMFTSVADATQAGYHACRLCG
jgi:PAS domain S-box-containing protein